MMPIELLHAAAVLAFVSFLCFAIGVKLVFVTKGKPGLGYQLIKLAAVTVGATEVYAIWTAREVPIGWGVAGVALLTSSLALFWLTARANRTRRLSLAYSQDRPVHLMSQGPYRFVRHPFYTSYLMAYIGGMLASGNPWLLIAVAVMTGIYVDAARREEAKFAKSALARRYAKYREQTGMFLPLPFGAKSGKKAA